MSSSSNTRRIPFEKRKRASASCDQCRTKRIKCVRILPEEPCTTCVKSGQECLTLLPRKKRIYSSVDDARYRSIESLLQKMFPGRNLDTADSINELMDDMESSHDLSISSTFTQSRSRSLVIDGRIQQVRPKQLENQSVVYNTDGRTRYIGPSGTLFFLSQLKKLLSVAGNNVPGSTWGNDREGSVQQAYALDKRNDLIPVPQLPSADFVNRMLSIYFESIHPDMIIFNQEQLNLEVNKLYSALEAPAVTVSAVFALFVAVLDCQNGYFTQQRKEFWAIVEENLNRVVNGSGVKQIQCLLLIAQIYHNNNERNTTWNLIGVAIRIAYSMGLHRQGAITTTDSSEETQIQRRVWWTLYCYERFLAVSLGRPSAIDDSWISIEYPEDIYPFPDGYSRAVCQIYEYVGQICYSVYHPQRDMPPPSESRERVKELDEWYNNLARDLTDSSLFSGQALRAVLMLQVYYHWAITLLTRPYFVKVEEEMNNRNLGYLETSSDTDEVSEYLRQRCQESSLKSIRLLCRDLWLSSTFNSRSWLDVFFVYSSVCILAVSQLRDSQRHSDVQSELDNALVVFEACKLEGTMGRFAAVSTELVEIISKRTRASASSPDLPVLQGPLSGIKPAATPEEMNMTLDFNLFNFRWLYSMDTL